MKQPKWIILARTGMIRLDDPNDNPGGGGGNDDDDKDKGKTFTQEDLNRVATKEKQDGERKARQDIAEQLGVSLEDAAAIIKKAKEQDDKDKSEAQRREDAAAAREKAANEREAEAKRTVFETRLGRVLDKAGMSEAVQENVTVKGLTVDSSVEDIQAAVDKLKKDAPALFGGEEDDDDDFDADPKKQRKHKSRQSKGAFGGDGADRFKREQERRNKLTA